MRLTWICVGELCRASENTACRDGVLLIIVVERIRRVILNCVGFVATSPQLYGRAVCTPIAASIVKGDL